MVLKVYIVDHGFNDSSDAQRARLMLAKAIPVGNESVVVMPNVIPGTAEEADEIPAIPGIDETQSALVFLHVVDDKRAVWVKEICKRSNGTKMVFGHFSRGSTAGVPSVDGLKQRGLPRGELSALMNKAGSANIWLFLCSVAEDSPNWALLEGRFGPPVHAIAAFLRVTGADEEVPQSDELRAEICGEAVQNFSESGPITLDHVKQVLKARYGG